MRGTQLHKKLTAPVELTTTMHKKGRNTGLLAKRNIALFHRYYYYARVYKVSYERILLILQEDFFLSPLTIADLLSENFKTIQEINKSQPSKETLKKKFPAFNWEIKSI